MKSGIQMNFLERRASADRALTQLVQMVRETTETLSSREQGGVYRLESILVEKSNAALSVSHVRLRSGLAARWMAFSTIVIALGRGFVARVCGYARRLYFETVYGFAVARWRVSWGCDLARVFVTRSVLHALSRIRVVRQWLRRMVRRAHLHWLLLAYRRKVD
jgi:hypothetical protein